MSFLKRLMYSFYFSFVFAKKLSNGVAGFVSLYLQLIYIIFFWQLKGAKSFELKLHFNVKPFTYFVSNRFELGSLNDIFVKEEYTFPYKADSKVILDLGANIGDTAVFYALKYPEAKIFAVEPNKHVIDKLKENTKNFPNIKICPIAVSNKTGKITLFVSKEHLGSSFVNRDISNESFEVDVYSLEDFCKSENISHVDILKFDIEGAEEYLLTSPYIPVSVGQIAGEMHDDLVSTPIPELLSKLPLADSAKKPLNSKRYIYFAEVTR